MTFIFGNLSGKMTWFLRGSVRSAGVAILKNSFHDSISHLESDHNGGYVLYGWQDSASCQLVWFNSKCENYFLFDVLEAWFTHWLSKYPNILFCVGGDFNIALDEALDRWPQSRNNCAAVHTCFIWQIYGGSKTLMPNFICGIIRPVRIDYWLISDCLDVNNINVNIRMTPLTDHRAVSLQISFKSYSTHSFTGN